MFYKVIGYITWNGAKWYLKRRFAAYAKVGVAGAAVTLVAAGYLATRSGGEG